MEPGNEPKAPQRRKPYPPELKERSVRLVMDHQGEYRSRMQAIQSVAAKMGMHWTTLHDWVRTAENADAPPARLSTDDAEELKRLRRENKELRRANAILRDASVFFATELDGRQPK